MNLTSRLLAFFLISSLVSCGTLRKSAIKEQSHSQYYESVTGSLLHEQERKIIIDTTNLSDKVVSIKEIEFYPDTLSKGNNKVILSDSTEITGSIKRVRETIVKDRSENATHKEDSLRIDIIQDSTRITDKFEDKELKALEKPVSDPRKWRYIFYILALLIVIAIATYFLTKKKQIMKSLLKIWKWFKC